jgi:hypothetical protein
MEIEGEGGECGSSAGSGREAHVVISNCGRRVRSSSVGGSGPFGGSLAGESI